MVHAFNNFRFMLQRKHYLEGFATMRRVRFQFQKSEFRLVADAMRRQPHAWEIRHDIPVFGSFSP